MFNKFSSTVSLGALLAAATLSCGAASAQQQGFGFSQLQSSIYSEPERAPAAASPDMDSQLDTRFQKQMVNFPTNEVPGTIIIDTPNTFLYLVMGNGQALRYGIGVGREGFTWSGTKSIARKAEWPDWRPPAEMIARQPYLPRFTAGGPGNPLGARAMYLGTSDYRIHGTNDPTTIGKDVSSGCIRLTNEDVEDLYSRVQVGAKVIVMPQTNHTVAQLPVHKRMAPAPTPYWSYAPASKQSNAQRT
jgi:lipoprotein-anchoring transpeptidase ErfK/SrfK